LLATAALGGGLYECFLIDRVWPAKPEIIQPARGGIDRKWFWMPMHIGFELCLIVAIWLAWSSPARNWLFLAAGAPVAMRVWSFAYFVPWALRFERAGEFTSEQIATARTWVRWSIWRLPLDLLKLAALCVASAALLTR